MIGAIDFYFTSFGCRGFFSSSFICTTERLVSDFQSFRLAFVFIFFFHHLLCLFVCLVSVLKFFQQHETFFFSARSWFYSLYLSPFRRYSLVFHLFRQSTSAVTATPANHLNQLTMILLSTPNCFDSYIHHIDPCTADRFSREQNRTIANIELSLCTQDDRNDGHLWRFTRSNLMELLLPGQFH